MELIPIAPVDYLDNEEKISAYSTAQHKVMMLKFSCMFWTMCQSIQNGKIVNEVDIHQVQYCEK